MKDPPAENAEHRDALASAPGLHLHSAALQKAVRLLRASDGAAYEEAWTEWSDCGDARAWDATTADGLP